MRGEQHPVGIKRNRQIRRVEIDQVAFSADLNRILAPDLANGIRERAPQLVDDPADAGAERLEARPTTVGAAVVLGTAALTGTGVL